MPHPLTAPIVAFASRLRFPTLFKLGLGLFVLDLVIPDIIPFADEILLGLATLILSRWKLPEPQEPARTSHDGVTIEGESRRE
jgi:hypothetical protein